MLTFSEQYKFKNFIKERSPDKLRHQLLPITHVTEFYNITNILDSDGLIPTPCDIFNEDLLYFFYGRPSYRYGKQAVNCPQNAFHPLCLVFDLTDLSSIDRIYPFDSGGFGHYNKYVHPNSSLEKFELANNVEGIDDLISFFYKSSSDYFDCLPMHIDPGIFEIAFDVESYYSMITQRGVTGDDERNSAIEIQTRNKVQLKKLKAIIFPKSAESIIRTILDHLGVTDCKIAPYFLSGITNPNDYFGEIKRIIREL